MSGINRKIGNYSISSFDLQIVDKEQIDILFYFWKRLNLAVMQSRVAFNKKNMKLKIACAQKEQIIF